MSTETMDLVLVDAQNAVQIFTGGGMAAILDGIEAKVRAIPLDPSTATGREEIRSVAYRVAKTKVALDNEGKKLTEGWREATKKVNEERKRAIDRLESLGEDVRKPLTDFENKEKIRVAAHEAALEDIQRIYAAVTSNPALSLTDLETASVELRNAHQDRQWEEFTNRATSARKQTEAYLVERLESRKKWEVEQEELARFRKEEAERLQRERDERLKAEAAEKARIEAERVAKEAADNARRESEASAKRAAELFRQEEEAKIAAEKRAKAAEDAAIAAKKKADADLAAAKEKAKRDAEAAVVREREKIERERKAADDARLKREADEAHRAKIRSRIISDLNQAVAYADDITASEITSEIADLIMDGKVRHVKVVY